MHLHLVKTEQEPEKVFVRLRRDRSLRRTFRLFILIGQLGCS